MAKREKKVKYRRVIQLVFAAISNSYLTGFATGTLYKGNLKMVCNPGLNCYSCPGAVMSVVNCYGSSTGTILQLGGNLYYRINRDWFAMGSLFLTRQTLLYYGNDAMAEPAPDPTITGLTGYVRAAYRF